MEIKSQRIVLKKLTHEDLEFICEMAREPLVYHYEADEKPTKEQIYKKFSEKISSMEKFPYEYLIFLIHILPEEKPIGEVFIQLNWEEMREWEVGYEVHSEFWGKGYATEAVTLLIKHCFENLNAHKVVGFCNANNKKSAKLMERIGMKRDGILREGRMWRNDWCDEYVYSILDKEKGFLPKIK